MILNIFPYRYKPRLREWSTIGVFGIDFEVFYHWPTSIDLAFMFVINLLFLANIYVKIYLSSCQDFIQYFGGVVLNNPIWPLGIMTEKWNTVLYVLTLPYMKIILYLFISFYYITELKCILLSVHVIVTFWCWVLMWPSTRFFCIFN